MTGHHFEPSQISEWFWRIINQANLDRDKLRNLLQKMTEEEIIQFRETFEEAAAQLTDSPYSDYMGEDVSEDTMKDVAECIVSQGLSYYSDIWNHPEKTPNYSKCKSMTTFSGVAGKVFSERFGRSIHG